MYGSIHGPTDYQVNIQVTSFQLLSALINKKNPIQSNCKSVQFQKYVSIGKQLHLSKGGTIAPLTSDVGVRN